MCIALDKSGSTYGPTIAAELSVVKQLCRHRQESNNAPVKVLPWCHRAYPPITFSNSHAAWGDIGSGGGTDPSVLYESMSCLAALRSAGLWVLMTDGKIFDSLVEKFAAQTAEVGVHNKPCIIVVFGDAGQGRPATCNISVGIAVYAVAPDCLFLFHDIPTGIVRIMQAKGKFKELLPLSGDERIKLVMSGYTTWAELPRVSYEDLFDVELRSIRNLERDEIAFQDGLIVNIPDMLSGKVDEASIEKIVQDSDNLRSIVLASKTKGTGKTLAEWLKAQQKQLPSKVSLPEDVGRRAHRAVSDVLGALRTEQPVEELERLRRAVRLAHELNMREFWSRKDKGSESESGIRKRNLRLRNAARACKNKEATEDSLPSSTRNHVESKTDETTLSRHLNNGSTRPALKASFATREAPLPFFEFFTGSSSFSTMQPSPPVSGSTNGEIPSMANLLDGSTLPLYSTESPFVSTDHMGDNFTMESCGYASGVSDHEERQLRQVNVKSRDVDDATTGLGLASRSSKRKRSRRSRSSSVCRDSPDPILVPGFRRHEPVSEFKGQCMLCHNNSVLTILLKSPPQVSTEGFPREGSSTKIAFPLAMGSFAETSVVSSFVSCDACAFHLLRIGTCPTSEIIVGALCLVSLTENMEAVLETFDLALRGRFDKADLLAIAMAILDAKMTENEKRDAAAADKVLFRDCAEWIIRGVSEILEIPASLSPAFVDAGVEDPSTMLSKLLNKDRFGDPSHVDNKNLLLLRYPIPGFLLLIRLLCLKSLTPEQAHTVVFHKIMFLVFEHHIARRSSVSMSQLAEKILDHAGSARANISMAELVEHQLLDAGSLQSLENGPDFEAFRRRSEPALAVFLHYFLRKGTLHHTAVSCFNALKAKQSLRNLLVAPLGISSGLAADMISRL